MSLFIDFFATLPRQGPGDRASTLRALDLVQADLPAVPAVLDIGCGAGAQTLDLAEALPQARITAVDLAPELLQKLEQQIVGRGLADRVRTLAAEMTALPAGIGPFDLIWSEGAIYIVGLDAALPHWRDHLAPGGYIVFSHIAWLSPAPAAEALAYWNAAYPAIASRAQTAAQIRGLGFEIQAEFALPAQAWWDDYYTPMAQALSSLPASDEAAALAAECRAEIELFRRCGQDYGYVFWLIRPGPPDQASAQP
ncbi:MAG: SAM-dependent methyltransferase [Candidatus Melainabacteria bacterium HGW-Melainabacteria-1]|nr:MAG: SAM-dependent methyltransferase [Candidatus Melainabacteria bacterium HGW-Melainabacteria-1]